MQITFSDSIIEKLDQSLCYHCRYFLSKDSSSLQLITGDKFLLRGIEHSEYKEYYTNYLQDLHSSNNTMKKTSSTLLHSAISKLHISFVPEYLPCRDTEKSMIQDLLREYVQGKCNSKPIYISGMPGSGKTATVSSVISSLKKECCNGSGLPEFQYIEINCLRLQSPNDACTFYFLYISCIYFMHVYLIYMHVRFIFYISAVYTIDIIYVFMHVYLIYMHVRFFNI